jgi:polar amino acid transport system substrate-binding protein
MYYVMIIVLIGFSTVRLLKYYNNDAEQDVFVQKIWDNLLVTCDALGQAAFIVTGVAIVIMAKIQPIYLWGPFFAFLTSNGGGILRDLIRKERNITCLSDDGINAEISVLWGLVFSIFLDFNAYNPDAETIKYAVIIVASGAFLTRMVVYERRESRLCDCLTAIKS